MSARSTTPVDPRVHAVRRLVTALDQRLATLEERSEQEPPPVDERLAELERAEIELARRAGRLRKEFDQLLAAVAAM